MTANDILDAVYTSVWDGGIKVETPCKFDHDALKCFDIQSSADESTSLLGTLDEEYVTCDLWSHGKLIPTKLTANDGVIFDY